MFRYNRGNKTKDVFNMAKHLDQEYKDYLCRLVVEEKRKVSELARELSMSPGSLYKWTRAYRKRQEAPPIQQQADTPRAVYKTPSDYEKELKEREKQIAKLEEQNAILKKAMHVFTKSQE